MKLLVTGGSGFLGRRTAAYFEGLGYQVLTPSHGQMDITDAASVREWFRENRPEAVIHTAAISDTGLCQREPERSTRINLDGAIHVAESCREFGAKLVFCSTDQVYYGNGLPGPHSEDEPLSPVNVYGNQKLQAEQRCREICPDTVCLRLSWMYSTRRLPGEHGNFLTTLVDALEDHSRALTWPVYDRRCITNVDAVIRHLPAALQLPGGSYNFGADNDDNTFHMVDYLLQQLGMEEARKRLTPNEQAFADSPRDMILDGRKAAAEGITFPTTKEGLLDALKTLQRSGWQ